MELQNALETMGLSEYEAKAYISLIQIGASNAGNLSNIAEIPRTKIYEVLKRLEKKKLIEVQNGRPLFYKAAKPTIAVEKMQTELKGHLQNELSQRKSDLEIHYGKKLGQISQAVKALGDLNNLYEKNTAIEPSEEFVWTIHGKDNLNSQAREIIQSASLEVRLMMPLDDFSEFISAIRTVASKGVKVVLIIHELTESVQKLKGITEVFFEESPLSTNCGIILADDKKVMFVSETSMIGFKASSKSVLMALSQLYQHELKESRKLEYDSFENSSGKTVRSTTKGV